jgi:hypothetical protein
MRGNFTHQFWSCPGTWISKGPLSFKIACRLSAIEHRKGGKTRILDSAGNEVDPRHYTGRLKDEEEEEFVRSSVRGIKYSPWVKLYSVERFWGGKWEVFLERADFLGCQRVAAVWHRRTIKMRIRDKETGEILDEKHHTGPLSRSQEECILSFTKRIGP